MAKVVKHQAKDGSLHDTNRLCEIQDRKLKIAPAMEKFVNALAADTPSLSSTSEGGIAVYLEDLPTFLANNAEKLRDAITDALTIRKPRKPKAVPTVKADANQTPLAA